MSYTLYLTDIIWEKNGLDMDYKDIEYSIGGYDEWRDISIDWEINDYMDNSDIKDDIIIECSYRIETIDYVNNTITEITIEKGKIVWNGELYEKLN